MRRESVADVFSRVVCGHNSEDMEFKPYAYYLCGKDGKPGHWVTGFEARFLTPRPYVRSKFELYGLEALK